MRAWRFLVGGLLAVLIGAAGPARMADKPIFPGVPILEPAGGEVPVGTLRARFMGTSTLLFDDGETAIMIDGFFTRPDTWNPFASIASDPRLVGDALKRAKVDRLAAVLVAHSHHDHAMDSADVALRTGADVVGSKSTANIALGRQFPAARIRIVEGGGTWAYGRFKVTVIPSPHGPSAFGKVVFPGSIDAPLRQPASLRSFREGESYAFLIEHNGLTILVHPSAEVSPGQYSRHPADVVFLGIGGLGKRDTPFADRYWREVVQVTGARLVVPIHWDDFTKPLSQPLTPTPWPQDRVRGGMEMITARARTGRQRVALMPLFEPVVLPRS